MKKKNGFILLLIFALSASSLCGQINENDSLYIGPRNGFLVLSGGYREDFIIKRFIDLAGGQNSKIIIIPTASEDERLNKEYLDDLLKSFIDFGVKNIRILHTRDTSVANSDTFFSQIKTANGIWFSGGRQWRLVDAYYKTKVYDELLNLLDRGGVIGGNSAGATICGSFLTRGDTKTNQLMIGDHLKGFGFIKDVAIDQHLLELSRQFDMFDILKTYPTLLGIGIDKGTAIVVHKNEFEVIGNSYVAIYDKTMWLRERNIIVNQANDSKQFYFLQSGDKYDLLNRKIKQ